MEMNTLRNPINTYGDDESLQLSSFQPCTLLSFRHNYLDLKFCYEPTCGKQMLDLS